VESDDDFIVITEDDNKFHANLNDIIYWLNKVPDNWDVITIDSRIHPNNDPLPEKLYKWNRIFYGAHFYIVRKTAAQYLLTNILYPLDVQYDVLIAKAFNKLNMYNIDNMCTQDHFITDIQNVTTNELYQIDARKNLVKFLKDYYSQKNKSYDDHQLNYYANNFIDTNISPIITQGCEAIDPEPTYSITIPNEVFWYKSKFNEYLYLFRRGRYEVNDKFAHYLLEKLISD